MHNLLDSVCRLGFGAMGLGGAFGQYDEQVLVCSVLFSLERGLNFVDTARIYGDSERLIGKAFKEWRGPRKNAQPRQGQAKVTSNSIWKPSEWLNFYSK
ncbi:aldo/keto reductase [Paenibacillus caseinilyticus]|uniref:NADP-dependent oxidoreductase domain-containing protein n=1 Tax=Paenibacillus mucilaginosus K02 TaxID=997761 RepID=I0BFD1_9BACL|nr:aldo/keto reductase [Paenibacillus mucilaginosus]AFH61078.1 hypothetical protein B2K_10140 [Paenibacillus mucilaginosus K02]